jgi:Protein kinase domain
MDKISTQASDDLPTAGTQEGAESELAISVSGTEEVNGARFSPGRIFASRYRIVTRLGRGGMGEVYRADDLKLGQAVALKLLATHEGPSVRRFVREVRLARGVTHPNVCRVYDIGEAEAWHYLSMEYVDGETLESLQTRIGVLPTPKAIDIARQLCAGVAAAHERAVLHRDLKPSNIMLDSRGRVRIMDFGLAVRSGDWGGGEIVGTPAYMAPEQLIGEEATEQTDLYALGLVLYELFTGRKPFPAGTLEDRMRQALASDPPLLPSSIGHTVADVIRACLKRNRADRPRTALDVAAALPGGDLLAAALAEGRIPPPDVVAAAGRKGALAPRVGWALLAPVVLGTFLVAANGASLTFAPADVPKPPEALAERSRAILTSLGHTDHAADSTYSFITVPGTGRSRLRFLYRESPLPLVPQNLFHVVTASDPPLDLGGMATVTLDTSGQLIVFSRFIDSADERNRGVTPSTMFAEAGLSEGDFVAITPARRPAVPHDSAMAWVRGEDASKIRVSSATLGGAPVYFEVAGAGAAVRRSRVFSTRRTPTAEALLSLVIVAWLASTSVMARHNLRAGESDVTGAFKLSLFTFAAGVSAAMLRSHHFANPVDEVILLLGAGGWCLAFAALNWLSYM